MAGCSKLYPFSSRSFGNSDQKIGVVAKTSPACSLPASVSIGSEFGFADGGPLNGTGFNLMDK